MTFGEDEIFTLLGCYTVWIGSYQSALNNVPEERRSLLCQD